MSGYRQHNFDPNAGWGEPGPPVRPYNWVQWTGVGIASLGVIGYLAYAADRLGWIATGLHDGTPFISLPLIGVALINSRRQPDADSGQRARNRKVLLIIVAVLIALAAAVLVIELKGA